MKKQKNITSANATIVMTVEELYPSGVTLEQFSTDQAISQAEETIAETRMGVDGQMVSGYVPSIKGITVTLEPSSPSVEVFDNILKAMQTNKTTYKINMTVNLPSVGKTLDYSNGVLKTGKRLPDVKKVLDPMTYGLDFEKVS